MALIASVAAAFSTICAAAAMGGLTFGAVRVPVAVYALCLLPGLAGAAVFPERRALRPNLDIRRLAGPATGVAMLALAVLEGGLVDRLDTAAPLMVAAVVAVSAFWPAPGAIRLSVLFAALGLLGTGVTRLGPVIGAMAGAAVALVAAESASRVHGRRNPTPMHSKARLGRQAALVAVVAGLAGLVASALVHPAAGGGDPDGGGEGELRAGPIAVVDPGRLEVAAAYRQPGRDRVLRVAAARADVWRRGTFDHWDGRAWDRSPVTDPAESVTTAGGRTYAAFDTSEVALGPRLHQRVTVEASILTALVAAPRAVFFEVAGGGRGDLDGWLLPAAPLRRGATYEVESQKPIATLDGELLVDEPSPEYRRLPPAAGREVAELASSLTTRAAGNRGKARAIERWLNDRFEVVEAAPELPPGDAVELVLFGGHPATTGRLATVMAVMLRSIDVPARVGVGYLPGRRDLLGGEFVVRSRDAHVWTEVWSLHAGWQRFDPTGRIASAMAEDSLLARLWRLLASQWPLLAATALVLVAWSLWRWAERRRRRRARPWATRYYDRVLAAGADRGRPRRPDETAAEYTGALAASVLPDHRLVEVGQLLTRTAYSHWQPSPEDRAWAEQVLREALRRDPE